MLATERLVVREFEDDDAAFLVELLNDPSFLKCIGDRAVRTLDDARRYVRDGPRASYRRFGFGLWCATLKKDDTPIGMCGLLKRDSLESVDVGFAFLPAFRSCGYAREVVAAVLVHARETLSIERVVAVVNPDNARSKHLLAAVGMSFERLVQLSPGAPFIELHG